MWTRWRADLARPETPTDRREVEFIAVSSAVIVGVAYTTDPGTVVELLLVVAAASLS